MLGIKKYFIGIVIGLVFGLWVGVNLGKDRPLWSNPLSEPSLSQKAKDTASDVWQDARKAAREGLSD